jgi:hypothetical protein
VPGRSCFSRIVAGRIRITVTPVKTLSFKVSEDEARLIRSLLWGRSPQQNKCAIFDGEMLHCGDLSVGDRPQRGNFRRAARKGPKACNFQKYKASQGQVTASNRPLPQATCSRHLSPRLPILIEESNTRWRLIRAQPPRWRSACNAFTRTGKALPPAGKSFPREG